jgi:hypothetical protein
MPTEAHRPLTYPETKTDITNQFLHSAVETIFISASHLAPRPGSRRPEFPLRLKPTGHLLAESLEATTEKKVYVLQLSM